MAKLLNRSLLSKLGQIRTFVFGYFSFNNEIAAFAVKVLFIFVLPQTGQNLVLLHVIIVTVCLKLTRGNEHGLSRVIQRIPRTSISNQLLLVS